MRIDSDWCKSYPTGRKTVAKYCNTGSDVGYITDGVPQGDLLAPLFISLLHQLI